jgi:quercetin dioxygenase-like cupin family protein
MFAPPPAAGTSGAYAQTRPYLETSRYDRPELLGQWPMRSQASRDSDSIRVVRETDLLWRIQGQRHQALVGILASTEHLTVAMLELQPGCSSDIETHGGDESLYVLDGTLNIQIANGAGPRWSELAPGDGYYVPLGVAHRYRNFTDRPVRAILAVAPQFEPG